MQQHGKYMAHAEPSTFVYHINSKLFMSFQNYKLSSIEFKANRKM